MGELYLAEEAIGLAKALDWNVLEMLFFRFISKIIGN